MTARTLVDKLWDQHTVAPLGGGRSLLHVDRHLLHDLSGAPGIREIERKNLTVHSPKLTIATPDHAVSSMPGRCDDSSVHGARLVPLLRRQCANWGIRLFDINDDRQGIVHVIGPELGLTLPGALLVCGDSHTCTHGALGALAWGIGSTELVHVLATQTIRQERPRNMRVTFHGQMNDCVGPKDLVLALIGQIGAAGGDGYAVEYAGPVIDAMPIEGRMTLCNLSIELGAKIGIVAPDDKTFEFIAQRPYAPRGAQWKNAVSHWHTLVSDADARFDHEISVDVGEIEPQITWGTSPEQVIPISGRIPDPAAQSDPPRSRTVAAALDYMGLTAGERIEGTPIDWVFIGSCTNGRLSDLRSAAAIIDGRKVAPNVTAWVVPGSQGVKRQAQAEGLDQIFKGAGFQWREPGCSMCVAANGEVVPPGARCISTSNRNFVGRQGRDARTHLASPAMAAAAAVAGCLSDVRKMRS